VPGLDPSAEVLQAIPHRPPFLWVDEVTERDAERLVTKKWIDPELPVFQGHYPDFPLLPGVLICEALFQTGALLLADKAKDQLAQGLVPVLTRVKDTRFRAMVRPGDTLEVEVILEESISKLFHLRGKARVGGKVAVSATFALALAPKPQEQGGDD
jgi:3-hydroxyacyl-[acyl-carrier-protein] dehydratase